MMGRGMPTLPRRAGRSLCVAVPSNPHSSSFCGMQFTCAMIPVSESHNSGIGPSDHFKRHRIEVIADNPSVGSNLMRPLLS